MYITPWLSEESAYNTSKSVIEELVDSLIRGYTLNYVGHRAYVCWSSVEARRERKHLELAELARQKYLTVFQERNRIHR